MSNEEILDKRWSKTDKTLKEYLPKIKKLGKKAVDDIKEMFDSLDITYLDLNKPISKSEKSKLDRKIDEWKENGLVTGYFLFLIVSKKKYTYSDMLEILIYGIYAEQNARIKKYSKTIFTTTANDIYKQAVEEKKEKPKKDFSLTWEMIYSLLWIPTYNKSWDEYLDLLALTNEQEMYKEIINNIGQKKKLNANVLNTLTTKQINRILSINEDKYSGALNDATRTLGNKAYLEPFKEQKDLQVRFVAEVDKKSTDMCLSMNNYLFYVNDWNRFYRYSDVDKKEVLYTVFGLEQGANLPPINNHFHWCRSTITYLTDLKYNELIAEYNQLKKTMPDEVPDTLEEYGNLRYNNDKYYEEIKSKEEVAKHYNKDLEIGEKKKSLSFKEYYNKVNETREYLNGISAKDEGIISEVKLHTIDRMIDRNISKEDIKEILEEPINKWNSPINNSIVYFKNKKMVAIDKDELSVKTVYKGRGKKNEQS